MGKSSKKQETSSVPGYVTDASTALASAGTNFLNKPFEGYTGQRVADFTPDQQSAFQRLRDLISNAPQIGGDAMKSAQDYGAAPAQNVGTERVVDENGRLGAIDSYLNPYRGQVVDAALRKIQEQSDKQAKNIGAMATASKAYGDARHGVLDAMLGRDTSLAMGETSGNLLDRAYDTAMQERSADLNRFKDVDTLNANFNEAALRRKLEGGKAQEDIAQADQSRLLGQINALLGAGSQQQSHSQAGLDAAYQEFMRRYLGDDQAKIAGATQALSGIRGAYDTTKTTTTPDNSLLGGIGSAAGSVLGSNGFWNWLSGPSSSGGTAMGGGAGQAIASAAAPAASAGLSSLLALI